MRFSWQVASLVLLAVLVSGGCPAEPAGPPPGGSPVEPDVPGPDAGTNGEVPPGVPPGDPSSPATDPPADPPQAVDAETPRPHRNRLHTELVALLADPAAHEDAAVEVRIRGPAMLAALSTKLERGNAAERAAAAYGLSLLGKEAAVELPLLRKRLAVENDEVARDAAAFAIDAIAR
jgi:hypothetical protein